MMATGTWISAAHRAADRGQGVTGLSNVPVVQGPLSRAAMIRRQEG